jgi:hypothetical protein
MAAAGAASHEIAATLVWPHGPPVTTCVMPCIKPGMTSGELALEVLASEPARPRAAAEKGAR